MFCKFKTFNSSVFSLSSHCSNYHALEVCNWLLAHSENVDKRSPG
jgi:hypothetical protein